MAASVKHKLSLDGDQKRFICHLLSLAREGEEDRGALAELRSGLGKEFGKMARVHKHVDEYLPIGSRNERWYYVTATLFGLFPQQRSGYSLGRAFRPLAFPQNEPKRNGMEARFVSLLNAHPDDLDGYLRHAVRLLEANKQPLDWFRLFDDLLHWNDPKGHVQLSWARDFYHSSRAKYRNVGSGTNSQHQEKGDDE